MLLCDVGSYRVDCRDERTGEVERARVIHRPKERRFVKRRPGEISNDRNKLSE